MTFTFSSFFCNFFYFFIRCDPFCSSPCPFFLAFTKIEKGTLKKIMAVCLMKIMMLLVVKCSSFPRILSSERLAAESFSRKCVSNDYTIKNRRNAGKRHHDGLMILEKKVYNLFSFLPPPRKWLRFVL